MTIFLKSKKDDDEKEKDRKISWLKTLVLDHNLKHFYEFFNSLEKEFVALKQNALNDTQKQEIDEKIAGHFIVLRRSFIDTLLAVDKTLYDKVLKKMDDYQGIITSSIFDNGINLAHQPKFEEILLNNLTTTKTDVLECLFNYRG